MHHALTSSNIINEIFCYLPAPDGQFLTRGPGSVGHQTLAALAVTCRAFRKPALAVRWRQLWGVDPLISLFPRDIWAKCGLGLEFARSPSEEEWIRFESHTSLVREIHIRDAFNGMVNIMAALSRKYNASPSQQLFPNLRVLKWHHDGGTEPSYAHLFFPPSLRCLQVTLKLGAPEDREVPRLMSLLEHQCPILTQFSISGIVNDEDNATIMRVLESRACQQLQSLDCGDVDESTLNYLAKLATLKDLSVHLLNPLSAGIVFNEGFVHLQTLSLTVEDMSTAIAFLSSTQLSLKAIKIRMPSTRPQPRLLASLEQLFSMLSTSHCHTRLTQFHLVRQPTSLMVGDIFHEGTLDIAALRPLFSFTKMRCVDIDGLCSFDLNDDSLAELANAWPHLEELTLNLSSGWQSTSEITFKGLRSLIQACPLLKSLALAIDATQLNPISRATPEDDIHNDKIEVLDLEDSTIENPIAVARILGKLFRSLKRVNVSPEEEELYELWDDVNSHLRKAQAKKQKIRL